jgi:hypothetical protein
MAGDKWVSCIGVFHSEVNEDGPFTVETGSGSKRFLMQRGELDLAILLSVMNAVIASGASDAL